MHTDFKNSIKYGVLNQHLAGWTKICHGIYNRVTGLSWVHNPPFASTEYLVITLLSVGKYMLAFARPVWWLLQQHVIFGMWWMAYLLQLIHSSSVCVWSFFCWTVFIFITCANYASQKNHHGRFIKNILCQKCCTQNSLAQDSEKRKKLNKNFSGGQKQNTKMPRLKSHSNTRIKEIFNTILPQAIYYLSLLTF